MTRALKSILLGIAALAVGTHAVPCQGPRTYQAEDAVLTGTHIDTAQPGYTGKD